jgi:hypothetical protein
MRKRRSKISKGTRQRREQRMVLNGILGFSEQFVEVQEAQRKAKKTWTGF